MPETQDHRTLEEVKDRIEAIVAEEGIKPLKRVLGSPLSRMIAGTKAINDGTFDELVAVGYEHLLSIFITAGAQVLIAHTGGKERAAIQAEYDYWIANQAQVMKLHNIAE